MDALLASRGSIFKGIWNKSYPDLFIKIVYPKIISGLISSLAVEENHIGSERSFTTQTEIGLLLFVIG